MLNTCISQPLINKIYTNTPSISNIKHLNKLANYEIYLTSEFILNKIFEI